MNLPEGTWVDEAGNVFFRDEAGNIVHGLSWPDGCDGCIASRHMRLRLRIGPEDKDANDVMREAGL